MKHIILFILLFTVIFNVYSQDDYPLQTKYPFVKYDENKFHFPGDKSSFEYFFKKLDTLIMFGTNQVRVLQIGASHTQADIFTGQLRMRLQTMYPGLSAGRGFIFPYSIIKTNSPKGYYTKHTGDWSVCRNVENKPCKLGVTGISATTLSENSSITITLREDADVDYAFNYIKILHATDINSYQINIEPYDKILYSQTYPELGYTEFYIDETTKEFTIILEKIDLQQNFFTLYGILLENTEAGIIFNPIGINGASTTSYNKCELFEQQMKVINPDWVIVALGTNDGYTPKIDSVYFRNNYLTLIKKIKAFNPKVAITLIVPNDVYYKNRYPNPNTRIQQSIIFDLAKQEGCSVWDMYEVMGGFNSSVLWLKSGLMASDKIHFSVAGYKHLADLLFTAFIDSYGDFMN